ncbi:MAG TPA: zinc ribbon domain-containing protein [Steroidobacteraceae bacterium]|nr:zinc ribbon domain-containing protein [Steroidobacteraceae bacterium]
MPFYEYECSSCKYYTEVMQKITDAPLTKCPSCGKKALKKLVSAPVFRLKGGGWYETDFKSDKENKRNLAGAEHEESAKADSTGNADSKPDAGKSDAKADAKADVKANAKADAKAETKAESPKAGAGGSGSSSKAAARAAAKPASRPATRNRSAARAKGRSGPARKKGRR